MLAVTVMVNLMNDIALLRGGLLVIELSSKLYDTRCVRLLQEI